MPINHLDIRLQLTVFALVAASFTNIYLTQPILPVLQNEFSADIVTVSFTVSAVILGITVSTLPFGFLADRLPIHPIILLGGLLVALFALLCALTTNLWMLIGARFFQGLFIPALTTCLAAYLGKTLPAKRLNVVMGSYVSATALGGLGGRLLGGLIQPLAHWRYAFVVAGAIVLIAALNALRELPRELVDAGQTRHAVSFRSLLLRWDLLRIFFCGTGCFSIFSSIFNYLPFRMAESSFNFSTVMTTLLYLVYILIVFISPVVGQVSTLVGSGKTLLGGSIVMAASLSLLLMPDIAAIILGILGICVGFSTIHTASVGSLNRKLSNGHGRANALYVLFYYIGGWLGITITGFAYQQGGWGAVVCMCVFLLVIPVFTGIVDLKTINGYHG